MTTARKSYGNNTRSMTDDGCRLLVTSTCLFPSERKRKCCVQDPCVYFTTKTPRNRGRTDKFLSHQLFFNVTLVFFFCFSSFWLLTLWLWDFLWKIRKILLFKKKGEREGPKKLCVISRLQQRNGKWVNSRRVCLGPLHMWWCARPFCYHSTRLI